MSISQKQIIRNVVMNNSNYLLIIGDELTTGIERKYHSLLLMLLEISSKSIQMFSSETPRYLQTVLHCNKRFVIDFFLQTDLVLRSSPIAEPHCVWSDAHSTTMYGILSCCLLKR